MNSVLPSGTVTFLFTDIENSTRLWSSQPEAMRAALAQHDDLLREAIESNNGRVFKTVGDAFCAAFETAEEGLRAAMEAQFQLQSPLAELPIKVRMALHTGVAEERDNDYFGQPLNHVARLLSAGHGGQILLSLVTEELIRDQLPEGVELLDLGEGQLKDLSHLEHIFQVLVPGLPADFPPLKTLDTVKTNLPEQLTTFVGRSQEMSDIRQLINEHRLITLVGPGGSGKTRLSLQVASDLLYAFPQGVWFVDLEKIESPEYLVPAVANTLQFSIDTHSSDLDPQKQLLDYLSRQSLLLLMDNFEHLLGGAGLITDILKSSPEARLMVTSRERLNLREEWVYPMSGLRYPQNGNGAGAESYSGIALFLARARQVDPGFSVDPTNLPSVSRICRLVDGLPLGIELAASWVNVLSCDEIAEEIEKDIDFLESSMRDVPEKHRSLRAIFEQSWRRITDSQQEGFRRLAVFRGGFSRQAAGSIADVSLATLSQFVQKSLLRRDKQSRFEMHPLLKAFAGEKLDEDQQEHDTFHERHSRYYVQFLVDRRDRIQGEQMRELREEIRAESSNVWAAISWAVNRWEDIDAVYAGLRAFAMYTQTEGMHAGMRHFQRLEQQLQDQGVELGSDSPKIKLLLNTIVQQAINGVLIDDPGSESLIERWLALLRQRNDTYELGMALLVSGIWSIYRGEQRDAIDALEESLRYLRNHDDAFQTVDALTWLGWAHYELGEFDQAGVHFRDSYEVCKKYGNILGLPYSLSKLGTWADAREEYEQGVAYHQEAMKYFEAIGDQSGQGYALSRMSLSAWGMKDFDKALEYGQAGYARFEGIGHRWGTPTAVNRIGFAEMALGQYDSALEHFYEGLSLSLDYNYPSTVNYALMGLAMLWARQGEMEKAAELLTMVLDSPNTPGLYRAIGRRALAEIEGELQPERFAEIEVRARAKDLQEAIDEINRKRLPIHP